MIQDVSINIEDSLAGVSASEWKDRLILLAEERGMHQYLGDRHFATFIDESSTLLVTFETVQGIRALSPSAQPFGFKLVKEKKWSHLCVISDGDTWFRDDRVYEFFDQLVDDGFFEEFDKVVFFGAGPSGYAAAAFSVAAPGATVVAVQPQATLDPGMTEWDDRFMHMRRVSFTDRYGYAPDMLDAAQNAFVLYDPRQEPDAMHATLFSRAHVTRLRLRGMGSELQARLVEMNLLYPIVSLAGEGQLNEHEFYRLYRARRDNLPYLQGLRAKLDAQERPGLNALLCRNVISRMHAPRFGRRLAALEKQADAGDFRIPHKAGRVAQVMSDA